ncbi:hypothetical protein D3C84_801710 [compost metagenome]
MLAKELAALVTGAGKGRVGRFGVLLQGVEEGWQEAVFIGSGRCFQLVAMVLGVGAGEIENAVDLQQHVRQVLIDFPGTVG